jgi:hypothetical protein
MSDSVGFLLFILAVLIFLGGFALGTQWNVRKGDKVLKWLREGLSLVGERTTMRWMGSSVVELKIGKAKDPFRSAETLVIFEPRDVFFLWAFSRWRGRRDTLVFRSQLRTAPSFELEIFDPKGWTNRVNARTLQAKNWTPIPLSSDHPLLAYSSGDFSADAKQLTDLATRAGGRLLRLSVHRDVPNLEVHWFLPELKNLAARDFFSRLREISQAITKG